MGSLNWDVSFDIYFYGIKCPPSLVSQVINSFVEISCGVHVYAEVGIVFCLLYSNSV